VAFQQPVGTAVAEAIILHSVYCGYTVIHNVHTDANKHQHSTQVLMLSGQLDI